MEEYSGKQSKGVLCSTIIKTFQHRENWENMKTITGTASTPTFENCSASGRS